jgi:superfamily II DNA/RNA helicase
MDSFNIHGRVIADYRGYIESFIQIKDEAIRVVVDEALSKGRLWPEPLIQFNPSYQTTGNLADLVANEKLHPLLEDIFRGYRLYQHQVEALRLGTTSSDFIVTSGTGSGKSLTYLGTIFDFLLKNPQNGKVTAVIVYPMNALINSQVDEIERYQKEFENHTGKPFPIRFGKYTGQENDEQRKQLQDAPPDILLTNYMMLELILTRIRERGLRDAIYSGLRFLVFDELHMYRGRQGADVAMLIRRIKAQCANEVVCIGTSATMVSGAAPAEQKKAVAGAASKLFGKTFSSSQVVGETLDRSFNWNNTLPGAEELKRAVLSTVNTQGDLDQLKSHPTAIWLENAVALEISEGLLVRRKPSRFSDIVSKLAETTGLDPAKCREHLQAILQWITWTNVTRKSERYTYLPFKLHQFISQTGSVYTTLDQGAERYITLEPGVYQADSEQKKPIFPNVFSRVSGHSFICVFKNPDMRLLEPREFREFGDDDSDMAEGYLIVGEDIWDPIADLENLPDAWLKRRPNGSVELAKEYAPRLPTKIYFDEFGRYSDKEPLKYWGWFMPAPLLFDPTAGVFFDTKTNESTKLTALGYEGRSTSTTITTFSILRRLEENGIEAKDLKLLSFTDNRQDAALQAGHFNDFLHVVQLRSAILRALKDGEEKPLDFSTLGVAIRKALGLGFLEFANTNSIPDFPSTRRQYEEALEKYLSYRAIYDLRRGWRVILPNLEQCALLAIGYRDLEVVAAAKEAWANVPLFNLLAADERAELIANVLDFFREEYALWSENFLTADRIKQAEAEIREKLKAPWKYDDDEHIPLPFHLRYETLPVFVSVPAKSVGPASTLGKYLRKLAREKDPALDLRGNTYLDFIKLLLSKLEGAGFLHSQTAKNLNNQQTLLYQLRLDAIHWRLGDGEYVKPDMVRLRAYKDVKVRPNRFFQDLYKRDFSQGKRLVGQDHTGQLKAELRIDREERFRTGEISALYCSPTMELGIDISNLNVVHMRNAPPNPANYVQRSGRAGRTGQAALVFTYCSSYSNHDRHYFAKQADMVAGVVAIPRLDLANEELLRTHLHAQFLSEVGLGQLDSSILNLLTEEQKGLPLSTTVRENLKLTPKAFQNIKAAFKQTIADFEQSLLEMKATWYSEEWISRTLQQLPETLDASLNRWRSLYSSARALLNTATQTLQSGRYTLGSPEYKSAKRNQDHATRQIDLLRNSKTGVAGQLSEFYPYRYFASEGFLPGYNFARLPLRCFIQTDDTGGEYLSRPRGIALREFGPGNIIYYNGKKYEIFQLLAQDLENSLDLAKISLKSGYFLRGEQTKLEICPFSGADLSDNANKEVLANLLEMSETRARRRERISCEEEERRSRGFDIKTFFSVDDLHSSRIGKAVVRAGDEPLLNLRFLPAARLVDLNRKWRSRPAEGFPLGLTTGEWKKERDLEKENQRETIRRVMLYTSETADSLYIEPVKALALSKEGVVTLQYALKRAIENLFQLEPNELGVVSLGADETPNILLYEAAEGTLGVLAQFVESQEVFRKVIEEAIRLCRYDDAEYKGPASYDDLLSYYNQREHKIIDRHLIKPALERLKSCSLELLTSSQFQSYEEHYQWLLKFIDPNSSTERKFLDYLHEHGLRLPDSAQKPVEGIYVKPDFFYKPDVWVFCDGTPHDEAQLKEEDNSKRQAILNRGEQVFVYHYKDDLAVRIASRPDIFKKVK